MSAAVRHLEDCLYFPEPCPLGCVTLEGERKGEVVSIERRNIPEHVRDSCPLREVVCEFCGGKVKESELNPHLENCEGFPVPCPNGCSKEGEEEMKEVKRKDIPVHLDNHCPLQKVQCAYWDHGCREEMERRHTDTHEREFLHIHFKFSMTEMKQKQNESTQRLQHELDFANEKIAVQELKFTQLNAVITKSDASIRILEEQITDKNDQIQSLSDIIFPYLQSRLPIGTLEWNIKGVQQKILNKSNSLSDPFYVGLYKFQSYIYWDVRNTGNVGVYIRNMKGNFDTKLHWPIRYRRTFVLINQINSKHNLVKSYEVIKTDLVKYPSSFERPTGIGNNGFGHASFISHTDILEDKYYKQDSITLHISVELLPPF